MERKVVRTYAFPDRDVREILVAYLKSKDMPAPSYVGDTPTCKWTKDPEGVRVEWTEEGELSLPVP